LRFLARQFEFVFPRPTVVMGIVNVTPDSFSDGGQFLDPNSAVARGLELEAQGAEIIDVGGESTRPGAAPVDEQEELRRTILVVEALSRKLKSPISIDTMKVGVARAALQAGASIVNDVGANRTDPAMWRLVAETQAGYVCMHMQGTPQTMQVRPVYRDIVGEVHDFFLDRLQRLSGCGVAREQIILDVGIGFGKTMEHNLALLGALRKFAALARPMLLGVSRKSFLQQAVGAGPLERLPAALACTVLAVAAGVQVVRSHDVTETVQALRIAEAVLARTTE
jgi:dihydropteroate synthase